MTPEEFDALPESAWDERFRYELIRGVLVVVPPPGAGERSPNDELGHLLRLYGGTHPEGGALNETLPEQTVVAGAVRRRCDRAIWSRLDHYPDLEREIPTIAIEFVSASRADRTRDYEVKRDEYRAAGVREYWIIDRFRRLMTVYKNLLPEGTTTVVVAASETYQTDLLPGFVLPVAHLLAKADAVPRKQRTRPPPDRGPE